MEENSRNPFKIIVIVLSVVAIILAGVLAYIWIDRQKLVNDLTVEKDQLTQQLVEMQNDYSILSSTNDSLNVKIDIEREKVDQLLERIKKTDAANRNQIRQYEKELGTLRSIMKHYIIQIDSLNTLNVALRKDAALAREQAQKSKQDYEELSKTTDEYAKQIEAGSVIKGRGVTVVAINASNKETLRSSRVEKLKTCLFLVENSIAKRGPKRVYIRVKDPEGIFLTADQSQVFNMAGEQMIYSDSREVDYQGSEVEICVYFANNQKFTKGTYTVEAFTNEGPLGVGEITLK
jgi:hypothetical protein